MNNKITHRMIQTSIKQFQNLIIISLPTQSKGTTHQKIIPQNIKLTKRVSSSSTEKKVVKKPFPQN